MTDYNEIFSYCKTCHNIDKCEEALGDINWFSDTLTTKKEINCEQFPKLSAAIKEFLYDRVDEVFMKDIGGELI